MKPYKLLVVSMIVLGLLLGGVLTLQTRAATVPVDASIGPPFYSMEDPTPQYFKITLSGFPNPYKPEDIDPDTLLVGGLVEMAPSLPPPEEWPTMTKKKFAFKVYGDELMWWVVLPQLGHMQPPHTRVGISISVTGQFYSGETFEGTCTLTVFTEKPEYNDPLPPP